MILFDAINSFLLTISDQNMKGSLRAKLNSKQPKERTSADGCHRPRSFRIELLNCFAAGLEAELQSSKTTVNDQAAVLIDLAEFVFGREVVRNLVVAQSDTRYRNRHVADIGTAVS